jgi:hypothetical protein
MPRAEAEKKTLIRQTYAGATALTSKGNDAPCEHSHRLRYTSF